MGNENRCFLGFFIDICHSKNGLKLEFFNEIFKKIDVFSLLNAKL